MVDRQPLGIVQHDVGRQVPVLRSQSVGHPGAEGGQACQHPAAGDLPEGGLVGQVGGVHRTDQGDVIGVPAEMGLELRDLHAAGAVSRKFERALEQGAGRGRVFHLAGDLVEIGLAMALLDLRFRIEEVHLARAAVHEQLDDRPGGWFVMGRARLEAGRTFWLGLLESASVEIPGEQRGERRALEARAYPVEEISPAERAGRLFFSGCASWSHGAQSI